MRGLRTDIQLLRAMAVLSVLIFHFEVPGLDKGFLGVDIFFVISGYLMSGVIIGEMDLGRFSASRFYLRRARRLLPAAFATLAATTAIVPLVLTPTLLADYQQQLLGALTFSANIFLWQQSGYFDGQASLKPLLHTWSLAVEEQFYLVLPLVLLMVGKRWRLAAMLTLLLGSAAACWWTWHNDPSGAFYLLHTRAWEMLIGSLCALCALPSRQDVQGVQDLQRVQDVKASWRPSLDTAWLAIPVLAFSLIQGVDAVHPRGDALLVCLATALLLVAPSRALQSTHAWARPLHWVGDRSYSLYLVHWPLIALAQSVWLEGVPGWVHAALLVMSFLLANLSYVLIEQPFRRMDSAKALAFKMLWLALPFAAASALLWHKAQSPGAQATASSHGDWKHLLRPNYGFARQCDQERDYRPKPACASTPRPRTLVWGDSYAMHLVPALLASSPPGGIAQATRSTCAPILDMARQLPQEPASRARRCLAFNQSVLAHLAKSPHIEFVVLSSRWQYFFSDPIVDARGQRVQPNEQAIAHSLADTVRQLRRMGKKVIVLTPPASIGASVNLGLCAERRALDLLTVSPSTDAHCGFPQTLHATRNAQVLSLMNRVAQSADVAVLRLDQATCENGRCVAMFDGVPLYRDAGHLSHAGSSELGRRMDLQGQIERLSR
jgi:peptidoglycan/LPS O-acetylase OafA/YrhL